MSKAIDVAIRLQSKLIPEGDCLVFTGYRTPFGYGIIDRGGRQTARAHRVAWELANGRPVPDGLFVMHACDNPPCCNPEHLSVGTAADNNADRDAKGRANWEHAKGPRPRRLDITHCPQGHPYSGDNLRVAANGHRSCATCSRERGAAARATRGDVINAQRAARRAAARKAVSA